MGKVNGKQGHPTNTDTFVYEVLLNTTFTGLELRLLFEGGREHYDARCRAAAHPGNGLVGGEIWGVLNQWTYYSDTLFVAESSETMFLRLLREFPEREVRMCLPFRKLDLFRKCVEMPRRYAAMEDRVEAEASVRLYARLGMALRVLNEETRRVNPERPPGE